MDLAIFGAKAMALGTYRAIRELCPRRSPRCFLVSQMEGNPCVLEGIPVLEVDGFAAGLSQAEKNSIEILIATPENVMDGIEDLLQQNGLRHCIRMTSLRWAELMGYYCVSNKEYMPLAALPIGAHRPELHVFMAKFYRDVPLRTFFHLPEWVVPIQVGAALCKDRVADILDCEGDNISSKNGNYSELTALYWMWKNCLVETASSARDAYFGLAHYRRMLQLSEDDLLRLVDNAVDVVLPYPMPYEPDIEAHHKRYLADSDWEALLTVLVEIHPDYREKLPTILCFPGRCRPGR